MNQTPLYDRHVCAGARMIDFSGWAMPVQYTGVIEEHRATRQSAGLFDICHMGEIEVRGAAALALLQRCLSRDLGDLETGRLKLSVLTGETGGILDDLTVYRLEADRYGLVTNAGTRLKDAAWLRTVKEAEGFREVEIVDRTDDIGKLDLQGPAAQAILQPLTPAALDGLAYYRFTRTRVAGRPALVSRSGYTGEDGFEIYAASDATGAIWDALLEHGAARNLRPVGLGARDTLRLEAGMLLYGHDMDETTTPDEVIYGWLVDPAKDFIGSDALRRRKAAGVDRKLVGFAMTGRGIAREGHPVWRNGEAIGTVTSGTFSPTLSRAIGLALVSAAAQAPGTEIGIQIRDKIVPAAVVELPFYRRPR